MKNDKVEFIMNKDLIEVLEYERRGTNPVVDEDIQQLLKAPGVAGFLNIPNFEQVVRAQSDFSAQIDRRLAERLKERGFGEIIEIEVEAPKINKNEVSKEANKPKEETINSNDDIGETDNISEKQASKKEFAPKDNDENKLSDNKELEEISQKIEELYKKKENVEENSEEEKQIKEQIEEQKKEQSELIGQYYYLTPERMLENLKNLNGGSIWRNLFKTDRQREAVERAYLTCADPGLLNNPEYLDDRMEKFLPEGENVGGLKGIHMLLLANTYVGYHVEERSNSQAEVGKDSLDSKSIDSDRAEYAMLEYPAFVSEMPESLKSEIREKGMGIIHNAVENILINNNTYTALVVVSDTDKLVDKALDSLELEAGNDYKGNAIKAYIKTIDEDYRKEFSKDKKSLFREGFDYTITFSEDDLRNESTIAETSKILKEIEGSTPGNASSESFPKRIEVSMVIENQKDVDELKKKVDSFKDFSSGTEVVVNYAIHSIINKELESQVNNISTPSGNVKLERDKGTEQDMAIDEAVTGAIGDMASMAIRMTAVSQLRQLENNSLGEILNSETQNVDNSLNPDFYMMTNEYENNDSAVQGMAQMVNDKSNPNHLTFDEAVYRLSMEADIPIEMAEDLLIDAGAQALEEDDFNPLFNAPNQDQQS